MGRWRRGSTGGTGLDGWACGSTYYADVVVGMVVGGGLALPAFPQGMPRSERRAGGGSGDG